MASRDRPVSSAHQRNLHRTKIVDLVAGVLLEGRKFLVEKRRANEDADPGYIEIPGGHVESGETLEEALRREMREELGITVEKAGFIQKGLAIATNGERGRIHYFRIEKWSGRIVSNEAEKVYWESEVSSLSIRPDRRAVSTVLASQAMVK